MLSSQISNEPIDGKIDSETSKINHNDKSMYVEQCDPSNEVLKNSTSFKIENVNNFEKSAALPTNQQKHFSINRKRILAEWTRKQNAFISSFFTKKSLTQISNEINENKNSVSQFNQNDIDNAAMKDMLKLHYGILIALMTESEPWSAMFSSGIGEAPLIKSQKNDHSPGWIKVYENYIWNYGMQIVCGLSTSSNSDASKPLHHLIFTCTTLANLLANTPENDSSYDKIKKFEAWLRNDVIGNAVNNLLEEVEWLIKVGFMWSFDDCKKHDGSKKTVPPRKICSNFPSYFSHALDRLSTKPISNHSPLVLFNPRGSRRFIIQCGVSQIFTSENSECFLLNKPLHLIMVSDYVFVGYPAFTEYGDKVKDSRYSPVSMIYEPCPINLVELKASNDRVCNIRGPNYSLQKSDDPRDYRKVESVAFLTINQEHFEIAFNTFQERQKWHRCLSNQKEIYGKFNEVKEKDPKVTIKRQLSFFERVSSGSMFGGGFGSRKGSIKRTSTVNGIKKSSDQVIDSAANLVDNDDTESIASSKKGSRRWKPKIGQRLRSLTSRSASKGVTEIDFSNLKGKGGHQEKKKPSILLGSIGYISREKPPNDIGTDFSSASGENTDSIPQTSLESTQKSNYVSSDQTCEQFIDNGASQIAQTDSPVSTDKPSQSRNNPMRIACKSFIWTQEKWEPSGSGMLMIGRYPDETEKCQCFLHWYKVTDLTHPVFWTKINLAIASRVLVQFEDNDLSRDNPGAKSRVFRLSYFIENILAVEKEFPNLNCTQDSIITSVSIDMTLSRKYGVFFQKEDKSEVFPKHHKKCITLFKMRGYSKALEVLRYIFDESMSSKAPYELRRSASMPGNESPEKQAIEKRSSLDCGFSDLRNSFHSSGKLAPKVNNMVQVFESRSQRSSVSSVECAGSSAQRIPRRRSNTISHGQNLSEISSKNSSQAVSQASIEFPSAILTNGVEDGPIMPSIKFRIHQFDSKNSIELD